jgi:RNA polymerase sigma-70 factor (ECF subfamily)
VSRAQHGDQDAFSKLYFTHKQRVFAICMHMVGDFALAEDLTQEVFLQLHRKLAMFRGESAFTTWLHRLTVNRVLMHMRKHVLPVVSLDLAMTEFPEEYLVRSIGAPDLAQVGAIDRLAIDRAAATLPPGYRDTFMLFDVQGFQHREIAIVNDSTTGTSKSQLYKARRALRMALSVSEANQPVNKTAGKQVSALRTLARNGVPIGPD